MTTIAHISDLHFGTEEGAIADGLLRDVASQEPSVVALSGDLTQRALAPQFRAARAYVDRLPRPVLAVPGNHDLPLYNLAARAVRPRNGYRRAINRNTEPRFVRADVALVSVDSTRHYFWKDGRVSARQLDAMADAFAGAPASACRIVMMHHPCVVPPTFPKHNRVDNADACLAAFAAANVEVVLAGHMHDAFVVHLDADPPRRQRAMVLSQAGTAISSRRRSQPNSYNIIRVSEREIGVTIRRWDGDKFSPGEEERFPRG